MHRAQGLITSFGADTTLMKSQGIFCPSEVSLCVNKLLFREFEWFSLAYKVKT